MFKSDTSRSEPLWKYVLIGVTYSFIYAMAVPVSDYFRLGELNWHGIIWAVIAFFISVALGLCVLWHQKNELKRKQNN